MGRAKALLKINDARHQNRAEKKEYINENYPKMSKRELKESFMEKFNSCKSTVDKLVTEYEIEHGIENKSSIAAKDGKANAKKEHYKFIREHRGYPKVKLVTCLMQQFCLCRTKAYEVINQYEKDMLKKAYDKRAEDIKPHKRVKPMLKIDDTSYFENSFNWNPKGVKK